MNSGLLLGRTCLHSPPYLPIRLVCWLLLLVVVHRLLWLIWRVAGLT